MHSTDRSLLDGCGSVTEEVFSCIIILKGIPLTSRYPHSGNHVGGFPECFRRTRSHYWSSNPKAAMAAYLLMDSIFHLKSSFWVETNDWKQQACECWNIPGFRSTFTHSICDGNDSSCDTDGNFSVEKFSWSLVSAGEGRVCVGGWSPHSTKTN